MNAREVVLEAIGNITGVAEVSPEMHLVADLGIDSPRALQLLVEIEDRLDIEIDDDAAAGLETVADLLTQAEAAAGS